MRICDACPDGGFGQCESSSCCPGGTGLGSLLIKTIKIDQLRPTQMTHGLREIRDKTKSYKALRRANTGFHPASLKQALSKMQWVMRLTRHAD